MLSRYWKYLPATAPKGSSKGHEPRRLCSSPAYRDARMRAFLHVPASTLLTPSRRERARNRFCSLAVASLRLAQGARRFVVAHPTLYLASCSFPTREGDANDERRPV